jgi:hypothetical protein
MILGEYFLIIVIRIEKVIIILIVIIIVIIIILNHQNLLHNSQRIFNYFFYSINTYKHTFNIILVQSKINFINLIFFSYKYFYFL